jgi:putative membrane protein
MLRTLILSSALALAFGAGAIAQPGPGGPAGPTAMTMSFVTKAAQSDEFERQEGRLAERRAHDRHVRMFAQEMVSAHTRTTQDLKAAIRRAGMTPPPPPALSDDQARMLGDLRGAHGDKFDRLYVGQQIQAHQETLGLMQGYAQSGQPGPIRDAAAKTAPLVQHHLDMATALRSHTVS